MIPTLLALASLFSKRYADFPEKEFPEVHRGVDSNVYSELNRPFDFIIVGSGYAGSFLARKLASEKCHRILVLEKGSIPTYDSAIPFAQIHDRGKTEFKYYTVAQHNAAKSMKNKKVRLAVGKALGGDSLVDSGLYIPPNLADFHRWSYIYDLRDWGYNEMKPYMFELGKDNKERLTNDTMRVTKIQRKDAVLKKLRRPLQAEDLMTPLKAAWMGAAEALNLTAVSSDEQRMFLQGGFFVPQTMIHNGLKMNPAAQFMAEMSDNLIVICNADVQGFLYTPDGRRVVGLEFKDTKTGTTYHVSVTREVILTAGTIGSAQILMQSGIGPSEALRSQNIPVLHDLPVGERLMDRVSMNLYVKVRPRFMKALKRQLDNPSEFQSFLMNGTGILANSSVIGCGLIKSGQSRYPDLSIEMKPVGIISETDIVEANNYDEKLLYQIDRKGDGFSNGVMQITLMVLRPYSQGTMWLWRKHDGTFQPRMNPSYLSDKRDTNVLMAGARHVEQLLKSKYFAALGAELMYPAFDECPAPLLPTKDNYWSCVVGHMANTGNHLTSTVPIGGVVDNRLRVRHIGGVRVADQSIFPESATGGMAGTVLAVANRAYRFIRDDNRLSC